MTFVTRNFFNWTGLFCAIVLALASSPQIRATPQSILLNDPVYVSGDFHSLANFYYAADRLADFDAARHTSKIVWQRSQYAVRHAFNNDLAIIKPAPPSNQKSENYFL